MIKSTHRTTILEFEIIAIPCFTHIHPSYCFGGFIPNILHECINMMNDRQLSRTVWVLLIFTGNLLMGNKSPTISPSVIPDWVKITTYTVSKETGEFTMMSKSLGFVIEPTGFIVSTYHYLVNPNTNDFVDKVEVEFVMEPDLAPALLPATVVAVEPTLDLSILKADTTSPLETCSIASREEVAVGQRIFAINTTPEGTTYPSGVITRLNEKDCYQESMLATLFESDVNIPKHGIGGPAFNDEGKVVGIYTAYEHDDLDDDDTGEKHTYVLPIHLVFNIYDSIKHKQSIKSPWTGFSVRPLTEKESSVFPSGIGIDYVWEGSPAASMGIQQNDILIQLGYYEILSIADFQKYLYQYGVGHTVTIGILRDTKYIPIEYTIEERPLWAVPK